MSEKLRIEEGSKVEYPVMRRCSYETCKNPDLGPADFTSPEPNVITHTICPECLKEHFPNLAEKERIIKERRSKGLQENEKKQKKAA
jgi:hypothetical protein